MIESLGRRTALLDQEDPSAPALTITGITFEGGDLSQPRYPSLIDYSRAPAGVQFEPGIQIISKEPSAFTVVYAIDPAAGVVFSQYGGLPVVLSVAAAPEYGPVPGLSAELLDPLTCQLTWNQAEAAALSTALRILCEPEGRPLTGPELVDGGVYLAIVHRSEEVAEPIQGTPAGTPDDATIKILGTDAQGRPRYDLYVPGILASVPQELELEVSFRVRKDDVVRFSLLFSLVPGSDVQFETVWDQVVVHPQRPEQLWSAAASDLGEKCTLLWVQQETGLTNVQGRVTSFFLEASDREIPFEILPAGHKARRRRRLQLDPTVIQPPNCTSGGICV